MSRSPRRASSWSSTSIPARAGPASPFPRDGTRFPAPGDAPPQSCAFRDQTAAFAQLGANIVGVSTQSPEDQHEFATREHIPYPLLSDPHLRLADALGLPTFAAAGMRLYRRLTLVARGGRIEKVFYPVFPPERNAEDVLGWLEAAR